MVAWREARPRSPPGTWRLLAPALLGWACAAVAVLAPGRGSALAVTAAVVGTCAFALGGLKSSLRGFARMIAVSCAVLVLLGVVVEAGHRVRSDAVFAAAAESGEPVAFETTLDAFPESEAPGPLASSSWSDLSRPSPGTVGRGWASAVVHVENGALPVVLWFDGERSTPDAAWAPGASLAVAGTAVRLEAGSSAAYGVRVENVDRTAPRGVLGRATAEFGYAASELRSGLRSAAERVPGAELVPGFAVGDTALVDERLELQLRDSSLLHLLAVSGDIASFRGE
ncbi:hypothetical protein [Leucobacter ruminantium]|uniref:DUF4131 domain-containing protein n=1 Tax=Leucobacter ruminantium TaxID=1289170 RepID=A0A939S054_9MICO|nr:hypothetical protein [Leucobacter ruminantium]MBO1806169.1 hypothetical protein [Leucobacter ruminantium]